MYVFFLNRQAAVGKGSVHYCGPMGGFAGPMDVAGLQEEINRGQGKGKGQPWWKGPGKGPAKGPGNAWRMPPAVVDAAMGPAGWEDAEYYGRMPPAVVEMKIRWLWGAFAKDNPPPVGGKGGGPSADYFQRIRFCAIPGPPPHATPGTGETPDPPAKRRRVE